MAIAALLGSCCTPEEKTEAPIISRHTVEVKDGRMTPEILWAMGRLSDVQIAPDGEKLLYGVSYYSVEQNKSNRELYSMNADASDVKQVTKTAKSEYNARWTDNGNTITFMTAESGSMQVWKMNADGTSRQQISNIKGGIDGFILSPDQQKIVYIAQVKYGKRTIDKYPDLPKASGKIVNDLMYKHWDEWVESVPHPFIADFTNNQITNAVDILEGEPFESPMKPFGGSEQIAFSPDSKSVAYTCRKKTGLEYSLSTNSDIYLYDIASHKTIKNLSIGNMGYDINPTFSPNGQYVAWESMERDGYESDKNRMMVLDLKTGNRQYISENKDQSFAGYVWDTDSENIYALSTWHATTQIYKANIANRQFTQITTGKHDFGGIVGVAKTGLLATRHSMSMPDDIYNVEVSSGEQTQISFENKAILDQIEMGKVEQRWVKTSDNKDMLVWVIYPPKFDATKKYPALLYCQGGPQGPVSQFWSYRWNFQMMASNDYIIVAPNRRGLYGFGQEWLEEISGDYAGQCMKDYFSAIDAVKMEPYVDETRLGAVGASFGGYSVYWLAGNHDKRFKAFISHDGMFNLDAQYLETEEMWFVNWDLGGAYWDKNNAVAQRSYANSPHRFVDKWDTPILIIHGEKDYRILASQGMSAFNAAILRGVPAELLLYPDENHWVLQPQNGILWQRTFFEWLDKYLK